MGVPRIDGYWGKANKKNPKNYRTRCSIFVKYKNINVIIDTSPDIKNQMLKNSIKKIDAVIYTHEHADQTHGINELRPIFWLNKKKIDVYSDKKTSSYLLKSFKYLFFKNSKYYEPILNNKIKPKKTILTNLHSDIDYSNFKKIKNDFK